MSFRVMCRNYRAIYWKTYKRKRTNQIAFKGFKTWENLLCYFLKVIWVYFNYSARDSFVCGFSEVLNSPKWYNPLYILLDINYSSNFYSNREKNSLLVLIFYWPPESAAPETKISKNLIENFQLGPQVNQQIRQNYILYSVYWLRGDIF